MNTDTTGSRTAANLDISGNNLKGLWSDMQSESIGHHYEPLSGDDLITVIGYAEAIRQSFLGEIPNFGFNAASVKLLSDRLEAVRLGYSDEEKVRSANLFGAFVGHALTLVKGDFTSAWVRSDDQVGIAFARGERQWVVLPMNRVMAHIEGGGRNSTYIFFLAYREMLTSTSL